jgi:hypothetical protein
MRLLLTVALLAATPAAARAELFVVPFMGMKFGGSTSIVDLEFAAGTKKFTMGGALMSVDDGMLGYEVLFGYVPGYFDGDDPPTGPLTKPGSFLIDVTASAVLSLPPSATRGGLRPYAVIGGGFTHAQSADILATYQVRRTVPVVNVGGGAIGLFTNNVGIRFDYRYFRSLTTDDGSLRLVGRRISYSRITAGIFLRL